MRHRGKAGMNMPLFDILITDSEIARLPERDYRRLAILPYIQLERWDDPVRSVCHFKGEAPSETVTILLGIAQGHPVTELLDRLTEDGHAAV